MEMQSDIDSRSEVSGATGFDEEDSVIVEPYDFNNLPSHACALIV